MRSTPQQRFLLRDTASIPKCIPARPVSVFASEAYDAVCIAPFQKTNLSAS